MRRTSPPKRRTCRKTTASLRSSAWSDRYFFWSDGWTKVTAKPIETIIDNTRGFIFGFFECAKSNCAIQWTSQDRQSLLHGENHFAAGMAFFDVRDRLLNLAQFISPVDYRLEFSILHLIG